MKEWATKQWQTALVWKLAIAKGALFSLVTLGAAWQVATAGMEFGSLHYWDRFNIIVGMFVLWGNQMISFLDKTASSVKDGHAPVGGQTEFLTKQKENG